MRFISYREEDAILDISKVVTIFVYIDGDKDKSKLGFICDNSDIPIYWFFDSVEEAKESFKKVKEELFGQGLLRKII